MIVENVRSLSLVQKSPSYVHVTHQAFTWPCHLRFGMSNLWSGVTGWSPIFRLLSFGTFWMYSSYPTVFLPFWTILYRVLIRWDSSGLVGSNFRMLRSSFLLILEFFWCEPVLEVGATQTLPNGNLRRFGICCDRFVKPWSEAVLLPSFWKNLFGMVSLRVSWWTCNCVQYF